MSNIYIGKGGKEYRYHENFNDTDKDLVIISSDDIAFRVDSFILQAHSSVFRSMLSINNSENNDVHLDHSHQALEMYLSALNGYELKLKCYHWKSFKEGIELCNLYDTPFIGTKMLSQVTPIDLFGDHIGHELFVLASTFNDILTACRIISTCGANRACYAKAADEFWTLDEWDGSHLDRLPSRWIWAYVRAHTERTRKLDIKSTWDDISTRFRKLLLPVSGYRICSIENIS
ncbi:uncharacterized protein I206_102965 [Kwoniella pini CBS 10737]|uniref:BTB domain-containing protein n=1 Tax=Kwoniella pini CBS 10737 TaxID=1296096 RepID=A0A1B9I6U7_9TREE|nr:uncharacterized protein I206_03317 [Kwoniella pini CBS 10737]OCF51250.1 hypothetical protein I206_03317 [Kwoniella pini CBS 10737]